ncbi:MAG: hypothetical protein JKY25_06290 [Robiginitomaculum sp.]|nr:hypothetical protein [Robiginitomaculum sp.]
MSKYTQAEAYYFDDSDSDEVFHAKEKYRDRRKIQLVGHGDMFSNDLLALFAAKVITGGHRPRDPDIALLKDKLTDTLNIIAFELVELEIADKHDDYWTPEKDNLNEY